MKMRLYYIAYEYSELNTVELIDGPYGTNSEASIERDHLLEGRQDPRLVIVCRIEQVEKV